MAPLNRPPASPSADALARADRLHLRYRAFGFAAAALLATWLMKSGAAPWCAGVAVITLAGWCLLTWTGYLLEARGVTDPDAPVLLVLRPAWAPRLLGLSDWVMAALLLWLVAGLKWHTFVLPALDALSGAGGPIFDSSR